MRPRTITAALACAASLTAGLLAGPATAAVDTTRPTWTKFPTNAIPLGAVLDPPVLGECDSWNLPVTLTWAARDPESGIAGYGYGSYDGDPADATPVSTSMTNRAWVEDDVCGGGGLDQNIYAFNGSGLAIGFDRKASILGVVQEDSSATAPEAPRLTYSGTWSTSSCGCWSGGAALNTRQSGAAAVVTLPRAPFGVSGGYGLGLVMAKGPDRGKVAVYVDGVKVATVDTYSSTKVNRSVVWRQTLESGTSTVRVVNLATPGRPRADLDAVVVVPKVGGTAFTPTG